MNKVILSGRLTRDPEVRYTNNGNNTCVARYSLAVDRRFKREGQAAADFFNCVAFGKQGEFVEKYLTKGTKIMVIGSAQVGSYTDKNGNKVNTFDIVVGEHEFCEGKNSAATQNGNKNGNTEKKSAPSVEDFMSIDDGLDGDELPFN